MNTKLLIGIAILFLLFGGAVFMLWPKDDTVSEAKAVDAVIAEYPALEAYRTTSLPPSSIESEQDGSGWRIAFIQRGSGVPGILNAHCFSVDSAMKVEATGEYIRPGDATTMSINFKTCAPINEQSPRTTVLPYGDVLLSMGAFAQFKGISIRPIGIVEDSRCPSDVQCIQAGTVRVNVEVVSGMGSSTSILTLGKVFTTEGERITLTAVTPGTHSKTQIATPDYRLTFNVVPQTTPVSTSPASKCYVGGCSAQLCTDQPDMASTCEYREQYACYKTAECKRQTSGQCGWTQTSELSACLANS